jgi:hypothetical protein
MHLENLIASVESSSEWRAGKAAQFPGDKRNQRSSDALAELTRRLSELAADNEAARAYEAVVERLLELDETERLVGYESRYVGKYGFDYPADGDPDDFLSSLTEQYLEWVSEAEEEAATEERERAYAAACEAADEEAKEAADEAAREVAEEAAKEAAEQAYREAYRKAYEEAHKAALIRIMAD